MEVNGPTAAILSDTCWDQMPFLGGIAMNIKFSPDQMTGEAEDKIIALIKTFLDRGGLELQVNAVNAETLRKARQNPEQYRDLLVRVGGYSDFFVLMSPALQAEMIERTEHRLV
jgi:formate C-acetyltransferase